MSDQEQAQREIWRAQIYRETAEEGDRYHAAVGARDRGEPYEANDVEWPPYEGAVGGVTADELELLHPVPAFERLADE